MSSFFSIKQSLFWSLPKNTLLQILESSENGLSQDEANKRLQLYGLNELVKKPKTIILLKFLSKFTNPLILILIFASLISFLLGEIADFFVIFAIVLISGLVDFYQEHQAQNAAEKLNQKIALTTTVIREGIQSEIPLSQVAIGDILFLSAGEIIPADARILESKELLVSQGALTGESFPQEKQSNPINAEFLNILEKTNCVFMGTNIISGEAIAIVIKTGSNTEFGKIAKQLVEKRPETEFETGVKNFGFLLMKITLIMAIFVFVANAYFKHDILQSLLFAVALGVGLTPELLPMILTINLSKGALRMSKKGVIVKYLPAIQNFGSMNILCTDKTGTLTEDKIKLERYEDIEGKEVPDVLLYGFLNSYFQTGIKSPLEIAVLEHEEVSIIGFTKVDEMPFDFERKRLSVVVKNLGKNILITKGAPEEIFHICTKFQLNNSVFSLTQGRKEKLENRFKKLSSLGFRVLALAKKQVNFQKAYTQNDEKDLTFLGLMAFFDPPKASAKEALMLLQKIGISIKILTGDNELVTQKVCQELGFPVQGTITGEDVSRLTDEQLAKIVEKTTIFARLDPEGKKRIILALKKDQDVVGYMGDGINDAQSLRVADVGISVNNAVDVAKQSADLILLNKDLHVLKEGVYEGRRTYANTMKYIQMAASSNFGNIFSVAAASLFLPFLPMLPTQLLLNNLLYDFSQLAVSSDNVSFEYLEKPRKWNIGFIKHFMLVFGPISSLFDLLTFFILLYVFKAQTHLFQTGWFMESLISQTLIVFAIRTKVVPFFKSKPSIFLIINSLIIVFFGILSPILPIASIFSFVIPPISFYFYLIALVIGYFILVEIAKSKFYARFT